jgi:hypothetical protein
MKPIAPYAAALLMTAAPLTRADDQTAESLSPTDRIHAIEQTHAGATYAARDAVRADFVLDFGPMHLEGTMWFTPSLSKVRMELDGGATMVFDGKTAWLSPADAEVPGPPARFHVLTWPYFAAAAYKLDDPGTNHRDAGKLAVTGPDDQRIGTKITFDSGVGDAPDDWYIAFADDRGRLDALAYIVTFGKSQEEAEKQPSIILYSDFESFDGVPFATTWTFHYWNGKDGTVGDAKGSAKLSNLQFVKSDAASFVKPDGASEATMPGS